MSYREPLLSRAWRNTGSIRTSVAWWIGAVLTGASLGVAGYYVAPGSTSLLFAIAGVVTGFFAPYALAIVWALPRASLQQRDEAWLEIDQLAQRPR